MLRTILNVMLVVTLLGVVGCPPPVEVEEPLMECERDMTVGRLVEVLDAQRENAAALKARGRLSIRWVEEGKIKEETPDVQVRFVPESKLFLDGRILGQEVIRLGTNDEEFWLRMKPDEISMYQWGRWEDAAKCPGQQLLNPHNLLEALGMVRVDDGYDLTIRAGEYVLTEVDASGGFAKRVYVGCADYLVRKIEYYGEDGRVDVVIELEEYEEVGEGHFVPTRIGIINHGKNSSKAEFMLSSVGVYEDIKPKAFVRPEPEGIKNVYRLNENCEFVRQTRE
ncbi:hypothetical protein STSP2_01840 [Anaerohalosphaera lusitana]|uniref:Outer membrane lipoprotein-sorting protein n=1 Tax=Anaerohalosphaera lusitana TaxID=1936003 RepID=A0A1U9NL59_9BACT|nr:hypothetical protein [Anaerohalosphaera lusitana]AQT68671.1 hypothetical protein STSP2_01840 [Anaerohalosphaera lusitana]